MNLKMLNFSQGDAEFGISQQNAAGHTLRSDFFQLDEREVEQIQLSMESDVYANFTLDGKGTVFYKN